MKSDLDKNIYRQIFVTVIIAENCEVCNGCAVVFSLQEKLRKQLNEFYISYCNRGCSAKEKRLKRPFAAHHNFVRPAPRPRRRRLRAPRRPQSAGAVTGAPRPVGRAPAPLPIHCCGSFFQKRIFPASLHPRTTGIG